MCKLFIAIIATTVLFLANAPAQAQVLGGFYVGGGLGAVVAGNTRTDGVFTDTGSVLDGQRLGLEPGDAALGKFDPSFTTNAIAGYDFGKRRFGRFRVEGELFSQTANTTEYEGLLNGTDIDPAGQVDTTLSGFTGNVLYDIVPIGNVAPYIFLGFGFGTAETDFDFTDRGAVTVDDDVQVITAGFGTDISLNGLGVNNAIIERSFLDLKFRFRRAGMNVAGLDTDIDTFGLELGLRYKF